VVLHHLQAIIKDDKLSPKFKVLMTVPSISSIRLKELIDDSYYVILSSSSLKPHLLSENSVGSAISSPSTPLIDSIQQRQPEETVTKWGGEDYDDED
jgi:hypothetical protein